MHIPQQMRLGLVLIVAGIGLACGGTSATQVDRGQTIAAAFLDEVRAGRIDPAMQATTVEFRSLMGSDALKDYARNHPALNVPAEFVASQPAKTGVGRMVEYEFRATPAAAPRAKTPPTPRSIRVLVNFATDPPAIERLTCE